jgi:hypothetical protein
MRVVLWAKALLVAAALAVSAPALAQSPELVLEGHGGDAPFQWQEARFGDRLEPHAALLLPVHIEGVPKTLYMQFDLGAPSTVLMKDKLDSLMERLPGLSVGEDGRVDRFAFTMGEVRTQARQVRIVDAGSTDPVRWDDPDSVDVIGTVGADLLRSRVLVIDYPGHRIIVGDAVPADLAGVAQFQRFIFTPRGVVLTGMVIDGEAKNIMLDTGSSAFALLIGQEEWLAKTDGGAGAVSFPVNSWGRTLTAHVAPTRSVAAFGDTIIPVGEVAYIEGVDAAQANAMRASGMGGMTGNKLFVDRILILDAVHSTYAVVAPRP